jgi:ATP-binding cassette subfamily C protein CydD
VKPVDPRLWSRIGSARRYVLAIAGLGFVGALAILVQALVLARMLAPALLPGASSEDAFGWVGALVPVAVRSPGVGLVWLAGIIGVRIAVTWLTERAAHRAGSRVVSVLREDVIDHAAAMGPRWVASGRGVEVVALATTGLNGLMPYFVRYVPALLFAATVTPLALVLVLDLDLTSATIALVTLPLIPIFMVLIGRMTAARSERSLVAMQRLRGRMLDLISGLPTLRALGRSHGPAERVRELGDAHRVATMGALRVAFLSGLVLELLTTLSVALIAVSMGFRLAAGSIGLETALAVLILAPEVYLPLRNVGAHFHAASDGLAAAEAAFAHLDEPLPHRESVAAAPSLAGRTLVARGLGIETPDGSALAPASLTFRASPGEVVALVGANGEGKSTALMAMAGLLPPSRGTVGLAAATGAPAITLATAGGGADAGGGVDAGGGGVDAGGGVDSDGWSAQVAWVPQRPDLGPSARTLSLGQRQRLALERAFSSGRPVLLLDEPTAHLDPPARAEVASRARAAADGGAVVIIATHDDAIRAIADRVVTVSSSAAFRPATEVTP